MAIMDLQVRVKIISHACTEQKRIIQQHFNRGGYYIYSKLIKMTYVVILRHLQLASRQKLSP